MIVLFCTGEIGDIRDICKLLYSQLERKHFKNIKGVEIESQKQGQLLQGTQKQKGLQI